MDAVMLTSHSPHLPLKNLVLLVCTLFFVGCGSWIPANPVTTTLIPEPLTITAPTWVSVGTGVERTEFSFSTTTDASIILYRFDPENYRWRFIHELPPARLSVWQTRVTSSVLMINGTYFHEDDLPSGLFISQGRRIGMRQFDDDKSGVLLLSPSPRILHDVPLTDERIAAWSEVAQSYPLLIQDGAAAVVADTGKIARRTFIGRDREGRIYMGIVPFAALSLYQLSLTLAQLPLSWDQVLNLDGGPSSGMMARIGETQDQLDSYAEVPNIIVVEPKK